MSALNGRLICHMFCSEGKLAEIVLIEPNGDEHPVRCLVRENGTDITGNGEELDYLNQRYGSQSVCEVARGTVLS